MSLSSLWEEGGTVSICKACGTVIDWVQIPEGKWIPLDPEPVFVIEGDGMDRFVTDEGRVITGRLACPGESRFDMLVAFVPHWKTCMRTGCLRRRR